MENNLSTYNDNQEKHINPQIPNQAIKRLNFKHFLFFGFVFLLIFALISSYFLWYVPQAQAKEYLEKVGQDFQLIQSKLAFYERGFTNLSKSLELSKQAFYEMTTSKTYFDAVEDTKKDIEDIQSTLQLINEAKQTKEDLDIPEDLISLDSKLTSYYDRIEEGMKLLLEFEEFQMKMLNASGDNLNRESEKFESIFTKDNLRPELISFLQNLSNLAHQSVLKFNDLTVLEVYRKYFNLKKESTEDLATSSALMAQELNLETVKGDKAYIETALKLSERIKNINEEIKKDSKERVEDSKIKTLFEESLMLEVQISDEFNLLKEKYGLKTEEKERVNEEISTPSATLEPTLEDSTPSATIQLNFDSESSQAAN